MKTDPFLSTSKPSHGTLLTPRASDRRRPRHSNPVIHFSPFHRESGTAPVTTSREDFRPRVAGLASSGAAAAPSSLNKHCQQAKQTTRVALPCACRAVRVWVNWRAAPRFCGKAIGRPWGGLACVQFLETTDGSNVAASLLAQQQNALSHRLHRFDCRAGQLTQSKDRRNGSPGSPTPFATPRPSTSCHCRQLTLFHNFCPARAPD
ncbi:hypothetical protein IWX50DRAFT_174656 [Phyllosticta citricarpa]